MNSVTFANAVVATASAAAVQYPLAEHQATAPNIALQLFETRTAVKYPEPTSRHFTICGEPPSCDVETPYTPQDPTGKNGISEQEFTEGLQRVYEKISAGQIPPDHEIDAIWLAERCHLYDS